MRLAPRLLVAAAAIGAPSPQAARDAIRQARTDRRARHAARRTRPASRQG